MAIDDAFDQLQAWYLARCDGDWEHQHGIEIGTLDNPGWSLRIDLADTPLAERAFARREEKRNDDDWFVCWVELSQFHAACGPLNLRESVETFLTWAG